MSRSVVNSQRVLYESQNDSNNAYMRSYLSNPSQYQNRPRSSQIAISIAKQKLYQKEYQTHLQHQPQSLPTDPILYQRLLLRMHPHKYLSAFFGLILLCSTGYGIFLPANYCAVSLITVMAFSLVGFLLELVTVWKLRISYQRITPFYIFKGVFLLVIALVHFVFLFAISDAAFCDYMWCQRDVVMKDFLQSFANNVGLSTMRGQCAQIQAQYSGTKQYNQISSYLLQNIAKYCVFKGSCSSVNDVSSYINGYTLSSNRGYLISVGIVLVIYAMYIFYFMTTIRHIRSQVDEYNTIENREFLSNQNERSNIVLIDQTQDISQKQNNLEESINQENEQDASKHQQLQLEDIDEEEEHQNKQPGHFVFDDDAHRAQKQNSLLQAKVKQVMTINKLTKAGQQSQPQTNQNNQTNNQNQGVNNVNQIQQKAQDSKQQTEQQSINNATNTNTIPLNKNNNSSAVISNGASNMSKQQHILAQFATPNPIKKN